MKVKVPDIEQFSANLCLKQHTPSMRRCDRKAGHLSLHSWEYHDEIDRLRRAMADIRWEAFRNEQTAIGDALNAVLMIDPREA